ncbi:hypothetical protein F4678DRAFT_142949 [Xylaria arbuscula]|nr:hypothetical protein F4678DRAFT_142949 [Xylaria arbuscula]
MGDPVTPKKQALRATPCQLPLTPPPSTVASQKEGTNVMDYDSSSPIRKLTFDMPMSNQGRDKQENSSFPVHHLTPNAHGHKDGEENQATFLPLCENNEREARNRQVSLGSGCIQDDHMNHGQESEATKEQLDANTQPGGDVKNWIYSAETNEQRRKRFYAVLHSTYPSNDEFNAARHPFYDPDEDDEYGDWLKYQMWEGVCPFDDDDYDPFNDPTRSTEVLEPQIGDEGIEDEKDLRMVLRAREEHRARSKALRKHIDRVTGQVSTNMSSTTGDSDSGSEYDSEEDVEDQEPAVKTEALPTVTNPLRPSNSMIQPLTPAKGIVVFGGDEPKRGRGRPRKHTNGRKNNKRKRGSREKPDDAYRYVSDPEDEQHVGKKRKNTVSSNDMPWKAQTRAAARRSGPMGMDGCYDIDSDSSTSTSMTSETDGDEPRRDLSSRHASFVIR